MNLVQNNQFNMANQTKHKTHKAAARRFKVTGTGKVMRRSQHTRHLQSKKTKKQQRSLKLEKVVVGKMHKKILQMLGQA